jgi:hypothetical protein
MEDRQISEIMREGIPPEYIDVRSGAGTARKRGGKTVITAVAAAAAAVLLLLMIPLSWALIAKSSASPAETSQAETEESDAPEETNAPAPAVKCVHEFGEWTDHEGEPCRTPSYSERTCSLCGYVERRVSAVTAHSFSDHVCIYCGRPDYDDGTVLTDAASGVELTYSAVHRSFTVTGPGSFGGGDLILPRSVGEVPVEGVGDGAFKGFAGLTSVTAGLPLRYFGASAFRNCPDLRSVTILPYENTGDEVKDQDFSAAAFALADCPALDTVSAGGVKFKPNPNAFLGSWKYPHEHEMLDGGNDSDGYPFCCGNPITECKYCTLCGYTVKREIGTFGHMYVNGVCRNCLKYDPEVIAAEGLIFKLNADGQTYSVAGMTAENVTYLLIPAEHEGRRVTAIAPSAFEGNRTIKTVRFEGTDADYVIVTDTDRIDNPYTDNPQSLRYSEARGVVTVGERAFAGCTSLSRLMLPQTLERIGAGAFDGDVRLAYADLPAGIRAIGDYAFRSAGLFTVSIGAETVGRGAFSGCGSLTMVYMLEGLRSIGESAFENCHSLAGPLCFPSTLETVGARAFADDEGTTRKYITLSTKVVFGADAVPDTEKQGRSIDPATGLEYYAYEGRTGLDANITGRGTCTSDVIVIPAVIAGRAVNSVSGFFCDQTVRSVIIEDGVLNVSTGAFSGCPALESVEIRGKSVSVYDGAFAGCRSLTTIKLAGLWDQYNNNTLKLGEYAFFAAPGFCIGPDENGLSYILTMDGSAYAVVAFTGGRSELTVPSVYRGLPVVAIEGPLHSVYTLSGEYNGDCDYTLVRLVLPDSITKLQEGALSGLAALESVRLPSGLTSIPDSCFASDRALVSVSIPSGVVSVGDGAFFGCESLTSIVLPDGTERIGPAAFELCVSLSSVGLGNSLTGIPERAFRMCRSLTRLTVPATVRTVGDRAFEYATGLEEVEYLSSSTELDGDPFFMAGSCWVPGALYIFDEETGLRYLGNPDGTYSVAGTVPGAASAVIVPDSFRGRPVTGIADYAFVCSGFVTGALEIPDSISCIGRGAFCGCDGLMSVKVPAGASVGERAFPESARVSVK